MIRTLMLVAAAAMLTACAGGEAYEPDPTTPYQWQQRQERIQRAEAERLRRCETLDKNSERYARECPAPGGAR